MDEKRASYSLNAPGSRDSGYAPHVPGRGSFPGVDDHLVVPEITRDEIIGGRRVVAAPAELPYASKHSDLEYVIHAHVAPGYLGATHLLTRYDEDSDFATDVCIFKDGIDPETGDRYLEEMAFEVMSEQSQELMNEKAPRMHRRGVRRIFTVWVQPPQICEWSPDSQSWRPLEINAEIEDPCLVKSLPVAALFDDVAADCAVARALAAKGNPVIRRLEAAAKAKGRAHADRLQGRAEGAAEAILKILEARGISVSAAQKDEILRCHDLDRLNRWLRRTALVSSAEEIISEP